MVTSQLPVRDHRRATITDAILGRLVHNAHRFILKGESLRKTAVQTSELDAEPVDLN